MELRIAVNAIGEIVGKTSTEDLLDMIFQSILYRKVSAVFFGGMLPMLLAFLNYLVLLICGISS